MGTKEAYPSNLDELTVACNAEVRIWKRTKVLKNGTVVAERERVPEKKSSNESKKEEENKKEERVVNHNKDEKRDGKPKQEKGEHYV